MPSCVPGNSHSHHQGTASSHSRNHGVDQNLNRQVYPNGRMSSYLGKMKAGDNILVSKPVPTIDPQEYPEVPSGDHVTFEKAV